VAFGAGCSSRRRVVASCLLVRILLERCTHYYVYRTTLEGVDATRAGKLLNIQELSGGE